MFKNYFPTLAAAVVVAASAPELSELSICLSIAHLPLEVGLCCVASKFAGFIPAGQCLVWDCKDWPRGAFTFASIGQS